MNLKFPLAKKYSLRKCPPMSALGYVPEPIFGLTGSRKSCSITFEAGGEISSTGLSYDDLTGCRTLSRRLNQHRRSEAPLWAFDKAKLLALLVRYCELRGNIVLPRRGTPQERLDFATKRMLERVPGMEERLTRLCQERLAAKRSGDLALQKKLEQEIRLRDAELIHTRLGALFILKVIWAYYHEGLECTQVLIGKHQVPPCCVRQLIFRLNKLWAKMESGNDRPVEKTPEECKALKRAYVKQYAAKKKKKQEAASCVKPSA